ncbi:hypothetical protein SAMN02745978_02669 [Butyricicoccus pullicaecorum DSM 23266]|uniref:Uncharacterized protein n=1 Tax=Butyricicoccus pullicaecorum 1.2 TaxID=1203606 RepID=R8VRA6_9FIRM|nr:hypothetical protein HMPREF1526_02776 [Butyricicoccus pullicaecorum 1.2]SKA65516.1 hypothetical protein SAMN02745978_02669 [Butyricicoccus pullicaecorum DSM 23266]
MDNLRFSSPSLKNIPPEYFLRYARKSRTAAHLECARLRRILRRTLVPLGTRLPSSLGLLCTADRVGKYELRAAGACRPALPVVLGLRCEREVYGTTANQVQVLYSSGAPCGSTICSCGADLRAWFGLPCSSEKICLILFYLTAFCIIRGYPSVCMCVSR